MGANTQRAGRGDLHIDGEAPPWAAEAILKASSDRIEPYIQSIRGNCMLSSCLPLMVEAIGEHFGRSFPPTSGWGLRSFAEASSDSGLQIAVLEFSPKGEATQW